MCSIHCCFEPFSTPEQLTELWLSPVSALSGRAAFTAWYRHSSYLQSAAALSSSDMNITGGRGALRVIVAETSANFFQLRRQQDMYGSRCLSTTHRLTRCVECDNERARD